MSVPSCSIAATCWLWKRRPEGADAGRSGLDSLARSDSPTRRGSCPVRGFLMRTTARDETSLLPSLLDRLLDDEPGVQHEPAWRQAAVLKTIRASVCRDLQCILNARRMLSPAVARYPELADSLVNYGLPDLQSYEVRGDRNQAGLCQMIQDTIRRFEPRLQQVRVTLSKPTGKRLGRRTGERAVAFEIEAVLAVDPIEEPVVFTSTLDVSRSEFDVEATR